MAEMKPQYVTHDYSPAGSLRPAVERAIDALTLTAPTPERDEAICTLKAFYSQRGVVGQDFDTAIEVVEVWMYG